MNCLVLCPKRGLTLSNRAEFPLFIRIDERLRPLLGHSLVLVVSICLSLWFVILFQQLGNHVIGDVSGIIEG